MICMMWLATIFEAGAGRAGLVLRLSLRSASPGAAGTFQEMNCEVLGLSRTTAKRKLAAGTFPIPALPRLFHSKYRFSAAQIDRYLARATADPRDMRRAG